jgi:hypothetical protein
MIGLQSFNERHDPSSFELFMKFPLSFVARRASFEPVFRACQANARRIGAAQR